MRNAYANSIFAKFGCFMGYLNVHYVTRKAYTHGLNANLKRKIRRYQTSTELFQSPIHLDWWKRMPKI